MGTWGHLIQILFVALALLAGYSLAVQTVVTGKAIGGFDLRILGRRVVCQSVQFRHDKSYTRLAIVPA